MQRKAPSGVKGEAMIISDSKVAMQSSHSFVSAGKKASSMLFGDSDLSGITKKDTFLRAVGDALDGESENGQKTESKESTDNSTAVENTGMSFLDQLRQQLDTIQYLLRILLGRSSTDAYEKFGQLGEGYSASYSGSNWSGFSTSLEYGEMESMSFSTEGRVQTADGRMIDFNVEVAMSRSFYQKVEQNLPRFEDALLDPLVVHISGNPMSVSDQKFKFDLDGDGELDNVSNLMAGSAFLALDKNSDGIINDGNELFGTKSGNGFADLAEYDLDGNGWIDEADEIFDKLRVFSVGADGSQHQITLKEAGIGAINLGSSAGDFSVKDASNRTTGVIRRSGFFLYENGRPGLMHQVDLAVS